MNFHPIKIGLCCYGDLAAYLKVYCIQSLNKTTPTKFEIFYLHLEIIHIYSFIPDFNINYELPRIFQ